MLSSFGLHQSPQILITKRLAEITSELKLPVTLRKI